MPCEHEDKTFDVTKTRDCFENAFAYHGNCDKCGMKLIEVWEFAGIFERTKDDEIGKEI